MVTSLPSKITNKSDSSSLLIYEPLTLGQFFGSRRLNQPSLSESVSYYQGGETLKKYGISPEATT